MLRAIGDSTVIARNMDTQMMHPAPHHSTVGMSVNPDKTMSAEASEMTMGGTKPLFGQIFDDSCDEGLILVSHLTGVEVRMFVTKTVYKDGDIMYWCLRSVPEDERRLKLPFTLELTIYND